MPPRHRKARCVSSKAPWFEIADKPPQYAEYAPD
jgi:hypothetical protein